MDDSKGFYYYLDKIISDLQFVERHLKGISYSEFVSDDLLNCSVCFKFVQASENSKKISKTLTGLSPDIPWNQMNGLRNRIVHDYGGVQLDVVYDAAVNDVPKLLKELEKLNSGK